MTPKTIHIAIHKKNTNQTILYYMTKPHKLFMLFNIKLHRNSIVVHISSKPLLSPHTPQTHLTNQKGYILIYVSLAPIP